MDKKVALLKNGVKLVIAGHEVEVSISPCSFMYPKGKVMSTQTTMDVVNEHGFVDCLLVEDGEVARFLSGKPITVCPQCMAHVMPNRGQGCLCDSCNHSFEVECEHDADCLFF